MEVIVGGKGLAVREIVAVARGRAPVAIAASARQRMVDSRARVERLADSTEPAYGVSTGFGALASVFIPPAKRTELQRALIRSHAAGVGPAVEAEVVRATMLLRLRSLAMGFSGTRLEVADQLAGLLNAGIVPVVPEHGSLGCSGDLAPLAHIALVLMGEGRAFDPSGAEVDGAEALRAAGLEPLALASKEGLALINGTDGMLANLVLAATDVRLLLREADLAAAMSIEALLGTDRTFLPDLSDLRPHPGQAASCRNLVRLLEGSAIVASHREGHSRVQDAYSLRCAPQVTGAARDTLDWVDTIVARELDSAIDNPVVLEDGRVASSGNFHGAPLALAADFLAIAAADVGSIAERRIDRMLDRTRSDGLPPFLGDDPGVDSGHMIAQYSAAGLVAENRRLAAPASVDSIPTSAMQEDHVSMGWGATRKLRQLTVNLRRIVAIEVLTAARATELRAPLEPAAASAAVIAELRKTVAGPGPDRFLSPEIEATVVALEDGSLLAAAESAIGALE
jgi:histidine ammonia-lyase